MGITCDKCGTVMEDDSSIGVRAYRCWNCGNRHYPGYPKRPGTIEICARCEEEFEKRNSNSILCDDCREQEPRVHAQKKYREKRRELRHVSAVQ